MKNPISIEISRLAFLLALPALVLAQLKTTDALPVSPDIKTGVLPNGLKYYIKKNSKPEKKMELRLAVNTGSILEDDDQLVSLTLQNTWPSMEASTLKEWLGVVSAVYWSKIWRTWMPTPALMKPFTCWIFHSTNQKI